MRVGARDAERRDARASRVIVARPLASRGEQFDRTRGPVDVRRRCGDVQRLREQAVPQREHHLDHARDTRRGLCVADVRLDRTQPERGRTLGAIGVDQGLGFDRVAQSRAGAVCLDDVDIANGQTGVRESSTDHALLRRPIGRGQAVGRAVLVDRGAANHREHLMPVAHRVGQPLQHDHADALGPARAVRVVGERLRPAVRRERALPGELGERVGRGHDRRAT